MILNSESVIPKGNLLWVTHGVRMEMLESQSIPLHTWNRPSRMIWRVQNKAAKELATCLSNCPIIVYLTLTQNPGQLTTLTPKTQEEACKGAINYDIVLMNTDLFHLFGEFLGFCIVLLLHSDSGGLHWFLTVSCCVGIWKKKVKAVGPVRRVSVIVLLSKKNAYYQNLTLSNS